MSTQTTNLKLIKPELSDTADITAFNTNWDVLDSKFDKDGKIDQSILPSMDYIPTSDKDKAGGVPSLDDKGKLSPNVLPESGSYISTEEKGVAGGVASLGGDGKVPANQLPEISSAKSSTVILYANSWSEGADERYYQTVNVADVTADAKIITVDVDLSTDDIDAKVAYLEAWTHPSANEVDQGNGTLTFYAWEKPTTNIPVNVGVM